MSMNKNYYPEIIENIIAILKSFPGIGQRGAERMVLAMLNWPEEKLSCFSKLLNEVPQRVTFCPECGNLAEDDLLCQVCRSASRNQQLICVVENFSQVVSLEKNGFFKGVYHVLGGRIAPLDGQGAESLNIDKLLDRIKMNQVQEVILALSSDIEGQATALYLAQMLKPLQVKVSRPAQGLPAGTDLSYADAATLAMAINNRTMM